MKRDKTALSPPKVIPGLPGPVDPDEPDLPGPDEPDQPDMPGPDE